MSRFRAFVSVLAVLAASWLSNPSPHPASALESDGLAVWACGDSLKVSPDGRWFNPAVPKSHRQHNRVWDDETRSVHIEGARGETVAFQLQLVATSMPLSEVSVELVTRWDAAHPPAHFSLFKEFYTEVRAESTSPKPSTGTGFYPDALIPFRIPRHGAPFEIARGRTQGVWIDVAIPRTAPAGTHHGTIEVRAAKHTPLRIALELRVHDFALEHTPSFRINVSTYDLGKGGHAINSGWGNRFDIWTEPYWELERRFYRMARAHRHTLHPRNYELPVERNANGTLRIDWSRFDARFGPLLDGTAFGDGRGLGYWEIALSRNVPADRFGGPGSEQWAKAVEAYSHAFVEHFREKGWDPTDLVAFPADEPSREKAFAAAQFVAQAIQRGGRSGPGAPQIRFRMDVYKALDRALIQRFDSLIDIWAVQGSYFKGLLPELKKRQQRGVEVWFYQGSAPALGPEILDTEGLALRTWGWIGWRYGMDAADLWECCKWQLTPDIWTDPQNNPWPTNGPGVLYYPGARVGVDEPIPSIRLKALRRGAFDYEYLALLASLGERKRAEEIAASVVHSALDATRAPRGSAGDWSHDPDRWDLARHDLAIAIESALLRKRALERVSSDAVSARRTLQR